MKRLLTVIVMAVALVGVSVVGSVAGKKVIKPFELKPADPNTPHRSWATYVSSASSVESVLFYAVVKLPVGKVIKKLEYYHEGTASDASTSVSLLRSLMAEGDSVVLVGALSNIHFAGTVTVENTNEIILPKIKGGYTYYIQAFSSNKNSLIRGVKITYQ